MTVFLIRVVFTAIEFSSLILLCLSLFRIYFRYSMHKVLIIALTMGTISVYIRDVLNEIPFSSLPVILTEIILITIFFGLPLIFSILVCIIGSLAMATAEGLLVSISSNFNLFTEELLKTSLVQFIVHELIVTMIMLSLVFLLQKYKLGFHTTSNDALKGYNFVLSAVLVVAVVVMQIEVIAFKYSTIHILIPLILGVIFLVGIYLSYKHNKKLWKERRERLSKK